MGQYDSGWLYDKIYSFKNYAAEAQSLYQIIQSANSGAKTLLDVACGTGKHLEQLSGVFQTSGLDLSQQLLETAKARNPHTKFYQGNMLDFELHQRFDAITCLFSAIGYLGSVDELNQAVATFVRHLEPGGVLLIEPWLDPEVFKLGYLGLDTVEEEGLKIVRMTSNSREGNLSRLYMHFMVGKPQGIEYFVDHHRLYLFSQQAYLAAFEGAGLEVRFEPEGLIGRGLYLGTKTGRGSKKQQKADKGR